MGKSIKKAFKSVTKAVGKVIKSGISAPTDALKALGRGDIGGIADAATRVASWGTVSLGDKGLLNAGLTNKAKEITEVPTAVKTEADGLLNYVSDLHARKSRRNRASTNNTGGSSVDGNKLSGTTALGV